MIDSRLKLPLNFVAATVFDCLVFKYIFSMRLTYDHIFNANDSRKERPANQKKSKKQDSIQ